MADGYNAADRQQVAERQRKVKNAEKQAEEDLRTVLATAEGRRFLWHYLGQLGVEASTFNPNAAIAAHLAGQRDAGQKLKALILKADERAYLLMMQESFQP